MSKRQPHTASTAQRTGSRRAVDPPATPSPATAPATPPRPSPGGIHAWEVSWLPGRHLDRNRPSPPWSSPTSPPADMHDRHRLWPHVEGWAAELGLTAPDALSLTAARPDRAPAEKTAERDARRDDPEAGE